MCAAFHDPLRPFGPAPPERRAFLWTPSAAARQLPLQGGAVFMDGGRRWQQASVRVSTSAFLLGYCPLPAREEVRGRVQSGRVQRRRAESWRGRLAPLIFRVKSMGATVGRPPGQPTSYASCSSGRLGPGCCAWGHVGRIACGTFMHRCHIRDDLVSRHFALCATSTCL